MGSYDVSTAHQDRDAELARLAEQASLGWRKEAALLEHFGLHAGMSILGLGSGPGFVTKRLHDLFPASRVTCVEIDGSPIEEASRFLADRADRVTFVNAS